MGKELIKPKGKHMEAVKKNELKASTVGGGVLQEMPSQLGFEKSIGCVLMRMYRALPSAESYQDKSNAVLVNIYI